jgi:predicted SprT family Zn-dependent metalloprotease
MKALARKATKAPRKKARPAPAEPHPAGLAPIVDEAVELWGDAVLRDVTISFSKRMRRSAGRALPATAVVRLHAALADDYSHLLREVVLHELAHVVVYARYGRRARPHGNEWKALMVEAALQPRTCLPAGSLPAPPRRKSTWIHRCPACDAQRSAGRPVRNWRCARCLKNGGTGELSIEKVGG